MILKNSSILSIEIVALDRNWIESEMNRNSLKFHSIENDEKKKRIKIYLFLRHKKERYRY